MEQIKQFAFSICSSAVVATLCYMILPNSNLSKVMKTAISIFFLSSLLSPWILDFDILDEIERYTPIDMNSQYREIEEETDKYIIEQFELEIKEIILSDLKTINVDPVNINISISKNVDETLYVDNVEVYLTKKDTRYKADVVLKIKNITQCQPQIYVTEAE